MSTRYELPSFEKVAMGKSWQELEALSQEYSERARSSFFVERRTLETRSLQLEYEADTLRALEVWSDPNSSIEERDWADHVIWLRKVSKAIGVMVPCPPCSKIMENGQEISPSEAEIAQHMDWMDKNGLSVIQEVLNNLPNPTGKIENAVEFLRRVKLIEVFE